jgi:predicted phage terminase large subunit-like protein
MMQVEAQIAQDWGAIREKIGPQEGPQTAFLSSPADITIFGGAAGSGKSYALLLEPLRNVQGNPAFSCVIFRRHTTEIRNPGGLWQESMTLYGQLGNADPVSHVLEWKWKKGGIVKMAHLEYDSTVFEWHGAQVPLIELDELTTFSEFQFFYLLSRNRSATAGIRPYIRATCNPDADSWVAKFLEWWIDQDERLPDGNPNPRFGFPIPERAGKIRYFTRVGDEIKWADRPEELSPERFNLPAYGPDGIPLEFLVKSVTFIPATIFDNRKLLETDPGYLANLLALPMVERERLLKGNWKIRPSAGLLFKRGWCEVVDAVPAGLIYRRGWDLAATEKTPMNDPDWTCGTKVGKDPKTGIYYVVDHVYDQLSPQGVDRLLKNTASQDGPECEQWLPQDPAQAGKAQAVYHVSQLYEFTVKHSPEQGNKLTRFGPVSSQAQAGNVKVLRGPWNDRWFRILEAFPDGKTDDDVDSTSRAFLGFIQNTTGILDYYTQLAAETLQKEMEARAPTRPIAEGVNGVRLKCPKGVNVVYDRRGRMIVADAKGEVVVEEEQGKVLVRSGFQYVNGGVVA